MSVRSYTVFECDRCEAKLQREEKFAGDPANDHVTLKETRTILPDGWRLRYNPLKTSPHTTTLCTKCNTAWEDIVYSFFVKKGGDSDDS